jgi:hypothetical protein
VRDFEGREKSGIVRGWGRKEVVGGDMRRWRGGGRAIVESDSMLFPTRQRPASHISLDSQELKEKKSGQ